MKNHLVIHVTNFVVCTLSHWGRVMHICVGNLTIIGPDDGLSPGRRQAIIWINAGILVIGPLRTNFSEILIKIDTFSFKKMHFKLPYGKWRPFCLGLNVLTRREYIKYNHSLDRHVTIIFGASELKDNTSLHQQTNFTDIFNIFHSFILQCCIVFSKNDQRFRITVFGQN